MPVPQENSFFVERASCPFLTMVQDISIAIMMEHPLPGKGGRHRQTIKLALLGVFEKGVNS